MKDTKNYGPNYLGEVIKIIDNTEVIINVGENDLTIGDKIIIYAIGDEIKDLDGTSLGFYEYDKATLNIITTTASYSICKTNKKFKKSTLGIVTDLTSEVFIGYEHISIDNNEATPISIENKDIVQIGDLVKKY